MEAKSWKKPANFKTDLARGRIGELAFIHASQGTLTPIDGRNGDMITAKGLKLEQKTDFYNMDKTENIFIEKYSYGNKLGGPFRALEDGSQFFAYVFNSHGKLFLYDTAVLVDALNRLLQRLDSIDVVNIRHTTKGYKVPRAWLSELEITPEEAGFKFSSEAYLWYVNYNKAEV